MQNLSEQQHLALEILEVAVSIITDCSSEDYNEKAWAAWSEIAQMEEGQFAQIIDTFNKAKLNY